MPSKTLEEYLQKASPSEKAALVENGLKLDRHGVEVANNSPSQQTPTNQAPGERQDVQQIGQDLKNNGAELKQDNYGPQAPARMGESRPHAEPPKFMDEQRQSPDQQAMTPGEKGELKQDRQDLQRDGQQNQPQATQQPQQKPNAVQEIRAADARRESQAKGPEPQKAQTQSNTKTQEPER